MDAELVERARHSREALERLVAVLWPQAYRVAFTILRDRGLAEDAAQEACAAVARSLPALADARAFAPWSYRIVTNAALAIRRRRPRAQSLEAVPDLAEPSWSADTIDLYHAMASLSEVQRAMLLLHYYAGLHSREIAEATGCSASTIRFQLMLARRALRKALAVNQTQAQAFPEKVVTDAH